MGTFGRRLIEDRQEIERRWYAAWKRSPHPHQELSEAALKNTLTDQIEVIGKALAADGPREAPTALWAVSERLAPEHRVVQRILIEEVVHEYGLLVDVVRNWVEEGTVPVSFDEYSYFHQAVLELIAESVRRYARYQAEEVSRERSEYLAGLAHQMRTPLTSLSFTIEQLEHPETVSREVVERLRRNVRRLSFLVNGVMRLERFKADELPVRPMRLRPARLIDEVLRDHEHQAAAKGLRLEVEVNRTLEMDVDPDLFLDVLGNLVDNAVKYTREGRVRVEVHEEPEGVLFRVIDSGPGMAEEREQALFHPVAPSEARGLGLGLTIAQRAVVALAGTIGVVSAPGQGTTVWFRLPWVAEARAGGAATTGAALAR